MENNPLVTIIIGNYNNENKVKRAIDSVMNQTYKNFELIITDDGSTDNSREVIQKTVDKYKDDRIHLFLEETNTAFQVLEDAYLSGHGKYISGLGGDDYFYPEKIKKQIDFLENHSDYSACFTYVDAYTVTGDQKMQCEDIFNHSDINNMTNAEIFRRLLNGNCLSAVSIMMRYDIFKSCGGYDFDYRQLQDYRVYLYAIQRGRYHVIPEKLTGYTFYSDNNISLPSPAVNARTWNETEDILYHVFKDMSGEFFYEAFKPVEGMAKNEGQLILQKIFFLINAQNVQAVQAGQRLFFEYGNREDLKKSMRNDYHTSRKDIYASTGDATIYRRYEDAINQNNILSELYRHRRFNPKYVNRSDESLVNELCDLIDNRVENSWENIDVDYIISLFDMCKKMTDGKNMFIEMIESLL